MTLEQALERPAVAGARRPDTVVQLRGPRLTLARSAWALFAFMAVLVFVGSIPSRYSQLLRIAAEHHDILVGFGIPDPALALYISTLDAIVFLCSTITALLIFRGRSDERMAIYVSLMLVLYGTWITRTPDALAVAPGWLDLPIELVFAMIQILTVLFTFLFPDGRFTPRWTMPLGILWIVLVFAWHLFPNLPFNPTYLTTSQGSLRIYLVWLMIGIIAQVYRYARVSGSAQRQQTKWVLLGVIGTIVGALAFLIAGQELSMLSEPGLPRLLYIAVGIPLLYLAALLVPLSIGISVERFRLWEIDTLINRTLVYGALTGMIALLYVGSILLLQQVFLIVTGREQSEFVTVISTLAIAALFRPLRRRIQSSVDRRFYRHKYDAARILAAFSATLRDEVDLDQLAGRLVAVVEEAMQPAHISLWLKPEPTADELVMQARRRIPSLRRNSDRVNR